MKGKSKSERARRQRAEGNIVGGRWSHNRLLFDQHPKRADIVKEKEGAEGEHGGAVREYRKAMREQGRAGGEYRGVEGEHINEMGVSAGAKRRHLSQRLVTCWPGFEETLYILYTPRT